MESVIIQLLPIVTPYIIDGLKSLRGHIPAADFDRIPPALQKPVKLILAAGIGGAISWLGSLATGDPAALAGAITGLASSVGYGVARNKEPKV